MRVPRAVGSAVGCLVLLAVVAGCGGGGGGATDSGSSTRVQRSPAPDRAEMQEPDRVALSRCPSGLPGCRSAEGLIVYVEPVDADGDGDAHFVILDAQSISLPGLTAIDVRKGLRPHRLPGIGERISAAGPVQTGTYGQSQIHAIELHVGGRAAADAADQHP
jgi:hypothetical protein